MTDQAAPHVRTLVALLMQRPITETAALAIKSQAGYHGLEIMAGAWTGIDKAADEMTTGEAHGWIETLILTALSNYVLERRAGRVYPGDVAFVLEGTPQDLRVLVEPDVSFVQAANVKPTSGFIYGAPDLAVEIVSPSQSLIDMRQKVNTYLRYGARQVWLVLPATRELEVHHPGGTAITYGLDAHVPGGDLLPDFSLSVRYLFET